MNALLRVMKMPWLATVKSRMWWSLTLVMWMALLEIFGFGHDHHHFSWQRLGVVALVAIVGTVWAGVANTLNLASDAHALRTPRVEREADACLLSYALLSIVTPALILGALFGHALALAALLLLAAGAVLAMRLSPAIWTVAAMVPAFLVYMLDLAGWIRVPPPGDPGFLTWAAPLGLALACVAVLRWVILRREGETVASSLWSPAVFNVRRTRLSRLRGDAFATAPLARSARATRGSRARCLRGVGPDQPVRSIRLVLHASMKPAGVFDRGDSGLSAQHILALAVVLVALLVMLIRRYVARAAIMPVEPVLLMPICIVLVAQGNFFTRALAVLWRGNHQNLAISRLLSNLGSPAQVKRRTLLACIVPGTNIALGAALIAVVIFALLDVPGMFYAYLALAMLAGIALSSSLMVNMLGGKPLNPLVARTIVFFGMVLASFTATWGIRVQGGTHPHLQTLGWPAVVCVSLWLAWCFGFALLGLRGWRALQRRPHPFLPNPPA